MKMVAPSIRLALASASSSAAGGSISAAAMRTSPSGAVAGGDFGHGLHPEHERACAGRSGQDRLDRRAVGEGYRLVVADDGRSKASLSRATLPPTELNTVRGSVRGLRDPIDRRGRISLGQEQVVAAVVDLPAGYGGPARRAPATRIASLLAGLGQAAGSLASGGLAGVGAGLIAPVRSLDLPKNSLHYKL